MSNSSNSGLLSKLSFGLFGNSRNMTNKKTSNNSRKNTSVLPVTAGVNIGKTMEVNTSNTPKTNQTGGVTSVQYNIPLNQRQPSEAVMEWATTAGIPRPTGPQMRNVAHGGKRRSHRKKRTHKRRFIRTRKHRKHMRKTHHKRRN